MTEPTTRPSGAAVAAALSPFLGLPLTVLFLLQSVGLGGRGEYGGGPLQNLSAAWLEGGFGMFLILGAGGLCSLIAAVLMFFGVQRGSAVVLANAPLASGLVAVGAFGSWSGMSGAIEAIAHAAPADRATILAGATGESLNTSLFGLCAMGGLLGALLPGLLLGLIAQTGIARRLLAVAMGVFGSLTVTSWLFAARLSELMESFKAVAHAHPMDRLTILVGVGEELARYRVFVLVALVALLLVAALGAVLVKASPKVAVAVPLMSLGGLFGFGIQSVVEASLRSSSATLTAGMKPLGLVDLEGATTFAPGWCLREGALIDCGEGFGSTVNRDVLIDELESIGRRRAEEWRREADVDPPVRVGVVKGAQPAPLWDFLTIAARARVSRIGLVGEGRPRQAKLPAELELVAKALEGTYRLVPIGLAAEATGCVKACTRASVEGDALLVEGQKWTGSSFDPRGGLEQTVAVTMNTALTPETLVKLALAAAAKERRLVVLMPDAVFPQDDGATEPEEPLRKGLFGN